jgi:hypothetical protein
MANVKYHSDAERKEARRLAQQSYRQANLERVRARERAAYHADLEYRRLKNCESYYRTKENRRRRRREFYAENREALKLMRGLGIKIGEARAQLAALDAKM